MQEGQTVSFSPMYLDGPDPWTMWLFTLFILVVLLVFSVRVTKLLAGVRKLRRAREHLVPATDVDSLFAECCAKAGSFKRISALTLFASLLSFTWLTANVFLSARAEKQMNVGYVLARVGDGFDFLAMGLISLIICVALYSAAMLFQAALRRRNPRGLLPIHDGREQESVSSSSGPE